MANANGRAALAAALAAGGGVLGPAPVAAPAAGVDPNKWQRASANIASMANGPAKNAAKIARNTELAEYRALSMPEREAYLGSRVGITPAERQRYTDAFADYVRRMGAAAQAAAANPAAAIAAAAAVPAGRPVAAPAAAAGRPAAAAGVPPPAEVTLWSWITNPSALWGATRGRLNQQPEFKLADFIERYQRTVYIYPALKESLAALEDDTNEKVRAIRGVNFRIPGKNGRDVLVDATEARLSAGKAADLKYRALLSRLLVYESTYRSSPASMSDQLLLYQTNALFEDLFMYAYSELEKDEATRRLDEIRSFIGSMPEVGGLRSLAHTRSLTVEPSSSMFSGPTNFERFDAAIADKLNSIIDANPTKALAFLLERGSGAAREAAIMPHIIGSKGLDPDTASIADFQATIVAGARALAKQIDTARREAARTAYEAIKRVAPGAADAVVNPMASAAAGVALRLPPEGEEASPREMAEGAAGVLVRSAAAASAAAASAAAARPANVAPDAAAALLLGIGNLEWEVGRVDTEIGASRDPLPGSLRELPREVYRGRRAGYGGYNRLYPERSRSRSRSPPRAGGGGGYGGGYAANSGGRISAHEATRARMPFPTWSGEKKVGEATFAGNDNERFSLGGEVYHIQDNIITDINRNDVTYQFAFTLDGNTITGIYKSRSQPLDPRNRGRNGRPGRGASGASGASGGHGLFGGARRTRRRGYRKTHRSNKKVRRTRVARRRSTKTRRHH